MIFVESRDAMKRLPLGGGAKEEDMGITELEEGETFSSHENNDMSMDLDSLSYIGAKLEHVLGHFQKDFEGGVLSAENLGAKFGGYGSFLPTSQRSPVRSHSRSTPRDQNCTTHEPVNIYHIEKTSQSNLVKEDLGMQFPVRIKESAPKLWPANQPTQSSDQKPLRVRIKVGSDTVPPKKNTELYNGLGLDVSPASSLNASPTEGLSDQPKDGPDVSPSSILMMMTSCPLRDGLILSPLPDYLICLTQKEKFQTEKSTCRSVQKGVKISSKGGHSFIGDDKGLGDFKVKSSNSDTFSEESKYDLCKDAENCIQGEEIVGNTLKLPLLSRSVDYGKSTAKVDDSSRIGNNLKDECLLSDPVKEETDAFGTALIKPSKGRNIKEEKVVISTKFSIHAQNGRKPQTEEVTDSSNWKAGQEALSQEEYDTEVATAKQATSVGNKKPKGKHVMQGAIVPKGNSNANGNFSKTKIGKSRLLDQQKRMNKCANFSGDRELGHGYNDVESVGTLSPLMPMNNELSGKNRLMDYTSKERRMMSVKKMEKAPRFDAPSKGMSDMPPSSGNGFGGDADDWVACDKCEKWRLLPPGRNPNSLPDKWVCSMLDWLPGLNRCSVSEEESTKALIALYQPPTSNGQTIQAGQSTAAMSGPYLSCAGRADQNRENQELPSVPCVGKKRPVVKEISNSMNVSNSEQLVNYSKKNIQTSTQSRSLNVVQVLPAADDLLHSSKHDTEKQKYKHKEKNKQIVYVPEGGDMRSSKTKNKGGPDHSDQYEDFKRDAKRTKRENGHHMDESRLHVPGLSADASWKEEHRSKECLKVNKNDGNGEAHIISSESGELDIQKYDDKDVRKRQHKQVYPDSFVNGHLPHDIMDSNHKTVKKAKVSKSAGKEGSNRKSCGKTAKRGKITEYQLLGTDPESAVSRKRVDASEPLVKDMGSLQPSLAAASSSSKVSGSIKNKDILQEMRGSPVESVSSSPLRVSNHDKAKFTRRYSELKEDSGEGGLFTSGTSRRSLDRQDKGRRERLLDTPNKDMEYSGVSKARVYVTPSRLENCHNADGCNGNLRQCTQYPTKLQTDQWNDEGKRNDSDGLRDASHGNKFRKSPLPGSKEKGEDLKPEHDKDKLSDYNKQSSLKASPEDNIGRSGKCRVLEKSRISSDKICAKGPEDHVTIEKAKREPQLKLNVKANNVSIQDQKQNQQLDDDGENFSKKSLSKKTDQIESSRKEKVKSLPPSGRSQNEACKLANGSSIGALEGCCAAIKRAKYVKGLENQNADQPTKSRNPASNGNRIQDVDVLSPLRRDPSSQAANSAIKEATNLKHMADRVKSSGESGESTSLYFQAALKFLHGASLLEVSSSETFKQNEMIQSMQTYSSTAKLCEFCAHEYEKSKDMAAAAALAYKCMEVAYMRVVYMSHSNASRIRQELQTNLQIVPGESPSSSASDIDNLNNPATLDKVPLIKGVSSPQVVGHHVISASNRASFQRLLNFAQEVNNGMEASRKSRAAFAAAKPRNEEAHQKESLSSVKRALDYSFHDVEGLLCLVRLAMDAMSY